MSPEQIGEGVTRTVGIFNRLEELPVPVIAAVRGACRGLAYELALRADVILADHTARFEHPEASLGIAVLSGGVQRVAEVAGHIRAFKGK